LTLSVCGAGYGIPLPAPFFVELWRPKETAAAGFYLRQSMEKYFMPVCLRPFFLFSMELMAV